MAERRMISKSLLMDNRFLSLSNDTKTLYIYLLVHTGYKMLENTDLKLSVFQQFFILVSY